MSLKQVEEALTDFAVAEHDRAVVLKGEWGTGKTHLWRQLVLKKRDLFKPRNYSYVSLFGLNSLKDLKQALYENKVYRERAHIGPDESSLEENIRDVSGRLAGWLRKGSSYLQEVSAFGVKGAGPIIQSLQFLRVTDTLICLDDFERKGPGLHDRDVMGLISLLLESKGCRVIMLLNDNALPTTSDFSSYHEKVFDYELTFSPSYEESAALIFNKGDETRDLLAENCIKLGINNVRLLRKIEYYAGVLDPLLEGRSKELIRQAHHCLPLAVHSIYGGDTTKADIDFILKYEGSLGSTLPDENPSPEEVERKERMQEQSDYLEQYGFLRCDEFDTAIITMVKKGYADSEVVKTVSTALETSFQHAKDIALLRDAWTKFHASFLNNEQEVVDAFETAIAVALDKFTLDDLDAVARIYDDLSRNRRATEFIDEYFEKVVYISGWTDKSDILRWPSQAYINSKLDSYFEELVVDQSIDTLIEHAYKIGLGSTQVRLALAKKGEDEYYEYFGKLDSYEFTNCVRACLDCGKVVSGDEQVQQSYKKIFMKTYRSIVRLGNQSPLNRARMSKFRGYEGLFERAEAEPNHQP